MYDAIFSSESLLLGDEHGFAAQLLSIDSEKRTMKVDCRGKKPPVEVDHSKDTCGTLVKAPTRLIFGAVEGCWTGS